MDNPLPQELRQKWGNLRFIKQRTSNTWSSECPQCRDSGHFGKDDPDRFTMWDSEPGKGARGFCRQCRFFCWADEDTFPDSKKIAEATTEKLRLLELEHQRIKDKLQWAANADFWRKWHEEMSPSQRHLWHREGINDWAMETYQLGYCEQYKTYYKGEEWRTPTMTIPYYGHNWQLVNVQHRLLKPPDPMDKYRNMPGVPMALFLTDPEQELRGPVLMIEGAKKSIVVYLNIGHVIQVVGFPSKTPSQEMIDQLSGCDPVYLGVDPDAYQPTKTKDGKIIEPVAASIGQKIGQQVRYVHFPEKPDDMIVRYGIDGKGLVKYLNRATVAA